MSARKVLKDNSQSSDDEAENERLRKEHEQNEKESINDIKEINDFEYNHIVLAPTPTNPRRGGGVGVEKFSAYPLTPTY